MSAVRLGHMDKARVAQVGKSCVTEVHLGLIVAKRPCGILGLAFGPPDCPKIHLLLVVPNDRKVAVPVFLGMNFCGNHALVKDPDVAIPTSWIYANNPGVKDNRATEKGRGSQIDVWALEQSIDR